MTRNDKLLIAATAIVWLIMAIATIVWDDGASDPCLTDMMRLTDCE
jgi:hypothetical protein